MKRFMYLLPLSKLDVEENSTENLILKRSRKGSIALSITAVVLFSILLYESWGALLEAESLKILLPALLIVLVLLNYAIFGDTIRFDKVSGDTFRNNRLWFEKGQFRKSKIKAFYYDFDFKDFSDSSYILKLVTTGYIELPIDKHDHYLYVEFLAEAIEEAIGITFDRKDDY